MEDLFIGLEVVYYVVKFGLLFKDKNKKPNRINKKNKGKRNRKKKRPSKK
ncbi:MAG: hypothetical protein ACQEW5_09470 [Bacillota bacterium]